MSNLVYPNLPGFLPTQDIDSEHFKKVSHVKLNKNQTRDESLNIKYPNQKIVYEKIDVWGPNENKLSTSQAMHRPFTKKIVIDNRKDTLKGNVLRFWGEFEELVHESKLETKRKRKWIILFYLEDNTISINEIKQENSGIQQGTFLGRQNILKKDSNSFLLSDDFIIGRYIDINCNQILIQDCDNFTRKFFEEINLPQPDSILEAPIILEKKNFGLNSSVLNGRVPSQKQFLENDKKVLKFFVYSDNDYIMHYYLSDDSIEICEINFPNSGKHPFQLLLKKQKYPKKYKLDLPGQTHFEEFITINDIKYNENLEILSRKFFVKGCDPFTRFYLKNTYNIDFPIYEINNNQTYEPIKPIIPPHNGFGDEEDSYGNCFRLIAKPNKKDFFKWVDNQEQLKLIARLINDIPEDQNREFIITFYLNDDNVMIYEPQQRNSGINGGKFLEKMKYKNILNNNEYFNATDFLLGKVIIINSYKFKILKCDERTKNWYLKNYKIEMK